MKRLFRNILKIILIFILLICLFLCFLLYKGHENYEELISERPVSLMREDLMSKIPNYVEASDISYTIKNSIVAIEDHRFYRNKGIDLISLTRAAFSTFVTKNLQGASTITMQLSKNYYYEDMSPDVIRKMSEVFFVYDLEANYTKEEILEMYLNTIYYGDGYYGIHDASIGYFKAEPIHVNYGQAALLAGIINAPSIYQLSTGSDKALQRQTRVINALYTYNFINKQERDDLLKESDMYKQIYAPE